MTPERIVDVVVCLICCRVVLVKYKVYNIMRFRVTESYVALLGKWQQITILWARSPEGMHNYYTLLDDDDDAEERQKEESDDIQ